MTETVLYDYWRSSAAYRMRIALNLAGIEYTSVPVDLTKGEHRAPEHLARNPQGLVPVLDIDGQRFTQSLAMLEYLDETRGMNLLPGEAVARAKTRALAYAIAVDLHPVCNLSVATQARDMAGGGMDKMETWMQRFIRPGLQAFEALLAGFDQSPYCCGDAPGLADICLMPQMYNAARWKVETADLPRLTAVATACAAHPAFAAAHPDRWQPAA
ncbi:MAG: maleylacetoacetate isomerase [Pseudooceanicola sp.]|nr:maleylacetoacetate isomerase [Pseudooceanicola sp.]